MLYKIGLIIMVIIIIVCFISVEIMTCIKNDKFDNTNNTKDKVCG